ncbi:MAG: M20/M25/M40 family metallo-hydrolase [Bacteroidota bacterium]
MTCTQKPLLSVSIILYLISLPVTLLGQSQYEETVNTHFKSTLLLHKEFVSIPNLPPVDPEAMLKNINWAAEKYGELGFSTTLLESKTFPLLLAEKVYDPAFKTVLFYFHIDGQPINPEAWDQEHPFTPVLKEKGEDGKWKTIDWDALNGEIDEEWRIFARAAADDKAPITMLLTALNVLKMEIETPTFNIKIIFDPEEEYGSYALLSTLGKYKERYAADFFIVMDGPAHTSNKPTVTFGCRGIASCSITTYGAFTPQHSGHYGNYVPNPVFSLSRLLTTMKDEQGRVLVEDYYEGIDIDDRTQQVLGSVPYDSVGLNQKLGIYSSEKVGATYQESMQYPSLNVRQIGTSWKGKGLKTVIPEYATAHLDLRLVAETDAKEQTQKVRRHIEKQGYYVIDRDPTEEERLKYPKIAKFIFSRGVNAFRTDPDSEFGQKVRTQLTAYFGEEPVVIRTMGGTVPIIPLINTLDLPTVIVPMVNMDNNQHSPNENIRIGNMKQGIHTCLGILTTPFKEAN